MPSLCSRTLLAAALLAASALAQAAPRPLLAEQSRIEFSIKEMGVSVSGRFARFTADIELDPARPAASTARVSVDIGSLTTGDADADAIAIDKPWLDKADFPKATFASMAVSSPAPGRYEVRGRLTIRGVTRELVVPLTTAPQPGGRLLATGGFVLKRSDFGIGGGEWNEGDLVADAVDVHFRLLLGAAP